MRQTPTPPPWHPVDIKAAIQKAGSNLTQLAVSAGLNPGACRRAVRSRHPAGERAIADFLDIPLWVLWPDRWRQQGGEAVRIDHRVKAAAPAKKSA